MASACHRVRSTCHRHKNRAASRGKTDAEMDEGERAGLAERLRHLKPVEPWHLYDSLNSDEAHEFVSFVLSVVALEAELTASLPSTPTALPTMWMERLSGD